MEDGDKHFSSVLRRFSPNVSNGECNKVSVDEDYISATFKTSDDCPPSTFLYDGITNIDASPKAIYKSDVMKLVKSVLQGYNGTLVSLGLESTDHFSFLLGSPSGILYQAAGHILSCLNKLRQKGMSKGNLTVQCSYVLIANEKVHDLLQDFVEDNPAVKDFPLDPTSPAVDNHGITISDSKVKGCKTIEAKKVKDIASMLRHGSKTIDAFLLGMPDCGMYHCSFAISIEYSKFGSMFAPMSGTFTTAVLIVPDQVDINTLGEHTTTDAKSIVALKKIIESQSSTSSSADGSSDLYAESLLTQLLQAAFGGNCKTLLMTHVPDTVISTKSVQTCSIMELASLARNMQNKPDKTELAEKALMDAYLKEMQRQMQNEKPTTAGDEEAVAREPSHQEDEVIIAQALASAANEEFEEDSDADSDDEIAGKSRTKKISLKPKTNAKRRSTQPSHFGSDEIPEEDMTVESLVVLIQNPDNGVPRASQRDLVNVQIHRGKGSVFSGAAIVTWFLENIDGVNSVEDAEQLGQILLDKGAIFHSDGSSCFLNAENLFYYARHPLTSGKLLSVEEIRALLASVKESEKQKPALQVTNVHEQSLEEAAIISGKRLSNDLSDQINQQDNMAARINQSTNETTESKPQQNECQQEPAVSEGLSPATSTVQQNLTTDIDNTPSPIRQTEAIIDTNPATEDTDSGEKETKSVSQAEKRENADQPNVNDLQDIDLVALERSTDYPHPLHYASAIGKPSGVIEQLIRWYGVDCLDEHKRTPLMFAALGNKGSVCRILIDCGAILDKREANGLTAIHTACYHGSKDALKVLLSNGANTAIIDTMFRSSYHWSTVPDSPACLEALLRHSNKKPVGLNDMVDKYGLTPLHWAIFYKHPGHLKLLVKRCPNLLKLDSKGRTLMTYAISTHTPQCVEVLATSQALTSAPDRSGLTPLHHAAVEESSFYVAYLLNTIKELAQSSCINAKDAEGRSPLHYATLYQRYKNVQLLLQFRADSNATDNEGNKPLDLARRYERVDERIANLIQGGPESEVDVNLILMNTQSQYSNHPQSKACIIL